MTVLNIPSDGYFNVLIVLYRAVMTFGPMPKERLLTLCSAGSDSDSSRLGQTLNKWTQLGFFIERDDKIELSSETFESVTGRGKVDPLDTVLPSQLRRILFKEQNNENFWDRKGTLAADLTRGLAFLLAQDIYAVDLSSHPTVQRFEQRQVSEEDRHILQNDVRWNGLRSWGRYLGFLWQEEKLWIDPTRALREDLSLVFGDKEVLSATDFMRRVAEVLPVLDGGSYRKKVESALNKSQWQRPARNDLLSTSLSRAIWRLKQAGVLVLENRADSDDRRSLQRSDGRDWLRFTHLRSARVEG